MKFKPGRESFLPGALAAGKTATAKVPAKSPAGGRPARRQLDELRVQVTELAESQMDVVVRVLRSWISH